jgi:hypothetical protein
MRCTDAPTHLTGVRTAGARITVLRTKQHAPRGAAKPLLQQVSVKKRRRHHNLCARGERKEECAPPPR